MKQFSLLILCAAALFSCRQPLQKTDEVETKTTKDIVIETIMSRRSIRSYLPEQIKDEELNQIIRCAINAPSARNSQSWEVRVVQKPEILQAVSDKLYGAPTVIVVASDKSNPYSAVDCGLFAQNALLAAEALNIGTCVIANVIPFFSSPEGKDALAQLNLPEGYAPLFTIAVGYKNEQPEAKPRIAEKVQVIK
ncbi:MAG: nitroreductase [Dysgonamonadaceae bacterium]|jgi:nitroreductase|nr:nitroreductase [Dysgonamonadaceae bacterium]